MEQILSRAKLVDQEKEKTEETRKDVQALQEKMQKYKSEG
jgi:hypothetical protein